MLVHSILNATEVRANFGGFIDTVVREKPQFVKRNRDVITSLSVDHLKLLLSAYELTFEYEIEDGKYLGSIEQIEDLISEADTLEEMKLDLAQQLIEYSQIFYDAFEEHMAAPNRKTHAPYILRVLLYDNVSEVAELLHG
ncbi:MULTISPECIES: hypothetical protein [Paenibacillus]|uniref:hypothetical protein n=1 Tax=Paenibacillus TaxID=44249 RepID=UPI0022B8779D|nr:hypothetical protein [Paenibacillus caseinilyticus]MCZ8522598.1 hypothetical protein [Paenibacillus caseinilyticus]